MAKATVKTTENNNSIADFIKSVTEGQRQADAFALVEIMKTQSGFEPKMWGTAIIGFGNYHYKYESGREGDAPVVGFSPRKAAFALYLSSKFESREELLKELGKHTTAKACIYIKKLQDINTEVLKKMVSNSVKYYKEKHHL